MIDNNRVYFGFRVITDVELSMDKDEALKGFTNTPRHEAVKIMLNMTENLDREQYIRNEKGHELTKEGCESMYRTLIHGLIAAIKLKAKEEGLDEEQLIYKAMQEIQEFSSLESSIKSGNIDKFGG